MRKCQADMLTVLSEAKDSREFKELIPKALNVLSAYASMLRAGKVPVEDLIIEKDLSKAPREYTNMVPQAIAARHLLKEGREVHAGQSVSYILVNNDSRIHENRALPAELADESTPYDSESYVELLLSSAMNLFLPFGYYRESLRELA